MFNKNQMIKFYNNNSRIVDSLINKYTYDGACQHILCEAKEILSDIIINNFSHNCEKLNKTEAYEFIDELKLNNNEIIELTTKYKNTLNDIITVINIKQNNY